MLYYINQLTNCEPEWTTTVTLQIVMCFGLNKQILIIADLKTLFEGKTKSEHNWNVIIHHCTAKLCEQVNIDGQI